MKTKWSELNIKEKLAIISAISAFVVGWALSIAGFIVPPLGQVHESILFILGQALVYSASVFGIAAYFKAESHQMKEDLRQFFIEKEESQNERLNLKQGYDAGETP